MHTTTTHFGARLPRQIQRALPVYAACILLVLVLSNLDAWGSSSSSSSSSLPQGAATLQRRQQHDQSTLAAEARFPRKIWQTWKVDPFAFDEKDLLSARTWTAKNPGHRYEVLTDHTDLYYVESHFGPAGLDRPDIIDMYRALTARIVKADLLRYLVMYVEGGVYADIDVEALKPLDRFVPDRYDEADVDMVIGVEIDQPAFRNHTILGKKSQSFCQWTFMCKPRLPVMMALVDGILAWLRDVSTRQQRPVAEIELDFDEIITGTGPSAFTSAVLAAMTARSGRVVDWADFHDLAESKLVGGVLVLTVEAFAAGQGHSDSGNHNSRTALVKHHYHASQWPCHHPRYSHPVYGEVEKCNWDPECVGRWDANTAAFETLSPDDQATLIAYKEAAEAHAAEAEALTVQAPTPLPALNQMTP